MSNKVYLVLILLAVIFGTWYLWKNLPAIINPKSQSILPTLPKESDPPQIVSTKPNPLEGSVISATEVIEITFNRSLENIGEFKYKFDPKVETKAEISQDRKTIKITHPNPYELGVTYTLFIEPDTKFDGIGRWGEEKIFHFRTIPYKGI